MHFELDPKTVTVWLDTSWKLKKESSGSAGYSSVVHLFYQIIMQLMNYGALFGNLQMFVVVRRAHRRKASESCQALIIKPRSTGVLKK